LSLYEVYHDPRFFRPSRKNLFYYVVFADRGVADEGAGDFGDRFHPFVDEFRDANAERNGLRETGVHAGVFFRRPVPSYEDARRLRYHYSVSLFHELGHAFGLGHGGALAGNRWDNTNYKINYPSVMNYRYLFWGVDLADGVPVMDFSRGLLSPISEVELFEPTGLGTVLNDHLLSAVSVSRVTGTPFPLNLDWNNDGRVTSGIVRRDLNQNGVVDLDIRRDHDDWGKLRRDGFDGIGVNAYDGCGLNCGVGDSVQRVRGDFNGDGMTDVFLHNGSRVAWLVAVEGDSPYLDLMDRVGEFGDWTFASDDRFTGGDFFGRGSTDLLWQRRGSLGVLELDQGDARLRVRTDGVVPSTGAPVEPWAIRATDKVFTASLLGGSTQIVISNHDAVAVLAASISPAEREGGSLVTIWRSSLDFAVGPDNLAPIITSGRRFEDGTESFFVRGAGFHEVRFDPADLDTKGLPRQAPRVHRVDVGGILPAEDGPGWPFSPRDTCVPADVLGDGTDELVLLGSGRLGVARFNGSEGRIFWMAEDDIDGRTITEEWDHLLRGQFVAGGGEELLLSSGAAWLTLGWDPDEETVRLLASNAGTVRASPTVLPDGSLKLRRGQELLVGRFSGREADEVLIADGATLSLAVFDSNGPGMGGRFRIADQVRGRVGEWPLHRSDRFFVLQGDSDPQLEVLAFKGELFGVFDVTSKEYRSFVREFDSRSLLLRNSTRFRRGDVNLDRFVDISDATRLLAFLFLGGGTLECLDAADTNDSGDIGVADVIAILSFLFLDQMEPAEPGPDRPGVDPSPDSLGCES
jgi:hypothetical protein